MTMKHKRNYKSGPLDNCQTPGYALDPLMGWIPGPDKIIWEPAAGEGYMTNELIKRGFEVVSSGEKENYFLYEPDKWDVMVTNPPHSMKFKWIKRAYELGKPWFLLLPVETFGAARAQKLFDEHGVNVIWLDKRINFKMPYKGWNTGGAQFPVCWIFWWPEHGWNNQMMYYQYQSLTKEERERYEV